MWGVGGGRERGVVGGGGEWAPSYKIIRKFCVILVEDCFFLFQNKPINLNPSYKMDLDFWDCFTRWI